MITATIPLARFVRLKVCFILFSGILDSRKTSWNKHCIWSDTSVQNHLAVLSVGQFVLLRLIESINVMVERKAASSLKIDCLLTLLRKN